MAEEPIGSESSERAGLAGGGGRGGGENNGRGQGDHGDDGGDSDSDSDDDGSPLGPYLLAWEHAWHDARDAHSTYACVHDKLLGDSYQWRILPVAEVGDEQNLQTVSFFLSIWSCFRPCSLCLDE